MKRALAAAIIALSALAALFALQPAAAGAQESEACFPGSDPDYPPTGDPVEIEVSLRLQRGQFDPGGVGIVVVVGADAGVTYCGVVASVPVVLPTVTADAQGRLIWDDFAVPAGFELNHLHHLDVFRDQKKVGNFDFCVNRGGAIAPASACRAVSDGGGQLPSTPGSRGKLAFTGGGFLGLLRWAVVALGIGGAALYQRRRRLARLGTA